MFKSQSNSWALLAVVVLTFAVTGCGKAENTVTKPDMSPEEFQAQIERNVEAAAAGQE